MTTFMICFLKVFEARTLDLLYSLLRETVSDFIFLGSKIAADGDCSQEIKRRLLLGRKVMTNLDSIFKSKKDKGLSSQGYGFSCGHVWM